MSPAYLDFEIEIFWRMKWRCRNIPSNGKVRSERWVDKEALVEHLKTPHLNEWRQKSANLLAEKTTIELYQSDEISF